MARPPVAGRAGGVREDAVCEDEERAVGVVGAEVEVVAAAVQEEPLDVEPPDHRHREDIGALSGLTGSVRSGASGEHAVASDSRIETWLRSQSRCIQPAPPSGLLDHRGPLAADVRRQGQGG